MIKNNRIFIKVRQLCSSITFWQILIFFIIGYFSLHVVYAKPSGATFMDILEGPQQDLPKAQKLLPNTEFHYETESHRLRIPRYMAYLLQNETFLERFPEFKELVPHFEKVITAANGHDIEKAPKHIYTKLAHDRGVDYDKLPPEEAAKAKAFRAAFNADGEIKGKEILRSVGFIDETGEVNKLGKLFYTLEAYVDRMDAYKFRAEEFGKKMLRPGDYIRQVLKPSKFTTDHYDIDKVAEIDDFVTQEKNKINLDKAVEKVTPQAYKKLRAHFRGSSPAFEEIQQEQQNKLVAEHNEKLRQVESPSKKIGAPKSAYEEKAPASVASGAGASEVMGRAMDVGAAGIAAHIYREATDPTKELGEAMNSAGNSAWNTGASSLMGVGGAMGVAAGMVYTKSLGDDMADRYMDPKVYEKFLNSPLEEQEMIFRQNNTAPFRSVIFSKRPRILQMQCSSKNDNSNAGNQEPLEFDIYSPERQKIHMKIVF
ncbi:MAG: hypothetical protein ACXVBQ_07960, partial [Pseudobdellovibrionaceae bacterium]